MNKWLFLILYLAFIVFLGCKESDSITEPEPEKIVDLPAELDSAKIQIISPSNNERLYGELNIEVRVTSYSHVQYARLYINNKSDSTMIMYNSPYNFIIDLEERDYRGQIELYVTVFANHILKRSKTVKVYIERLSTPYLMASCGDSTINLLWHDNFSFEDGHTLERNKNGGEFEVIADLPNSHENFTDHPDDTTNIYAYRVKTYVDSVYSPYSNTISAKSVGEYKIATRYNGPNLPHSGTDRGVQLSVNKNNNTLGFAWENGYEVGFIKLDYYSYRGSILTNQYEKVLSTYPSVQSDNIWVGTEANKVYEMNKLEGYRRAVIVKGDSITAMHENLVNNNLVYGTSDGHLGSVNINSRQMNFFEKVSDKEIKHLIVTSTGGIYFLSGDQCLNKFDPIGGEIDCITFDRILTTILATKDNIFIGSMSGVVFVSDNSSELTRGNFRSFQLHNGRIWDFDFSKDRLLSYGADNNLLLSTVDEFNDLKIAYRINHQPIEKTVNIASSNDNRLLFVSSDNTLYLTSYRRFWEKVN